MLGGDEKHLPLVHPIECQHVISTIPSDSPMGLLLALEALWKTFPVGLDCTGCGNADLAKFNRKKGTVIKPVGVQVVTLVVHPLCKGHHNTTCVGAQVCRSAAFPCRSRCRSCTCTGTCYLPVQKPLFPRAGPPRGYWRPRARPKAGAPPAHRVVGVSPPSSRGVWGHAPPGKFEILGTLRCVLRPSEVVQFMHAK